MTTVQRASAEAWTGSYGRVQADEDEPVPSWVRRLPPREPNLPYADPSARSDAPRPILDADEGQAPRSATRYILPRVVIVFVAASFVMLTVTGTRGLAFNALVFASSFLLLLILAYLVFGGEHGPSTPRAIEALVPPRAPLPTPRPAEAAPPRPALVPVRPLPPVPGSASEGAVREFVRSLVAVPRPPAGALTPAARRAYLEDLRQEGKRLIDMARVTGLNVEPYRAYLLDARTAATVGDSEGALRSIRLANELLRSSVENSLLKHQRVRRVGRDGTR